MYVSWPNSRAAAVRNRKEMNVVERSVVRGAIMKSGMQCLQNKEFGGCGVYIRIVISMHGLPGNTAKEVPRIKWQIN
jgi:hypothetical protein